MRRFIQFLSALFVLGLVMTERAGAETPEPNPERTVFMAARVAEMAGAEVARVLVVHDPNLALSLQTADRIKTAGDNDAILVGRRALPVTLVDVAEMPRFDPTTLVYVTANLDDRHPVVAEAARSSGALVASGDLDCVRSAFCSLGVSLQPRTELYLSRSAAEAAGISFGANFRAFVKEID